MIENKNLKPVKPDLVRLYWENEESITGTCQVSDSKVMELHHCH